VDCPRKVFFSDPEYIEITSKTSVWTWDIHSRSTIGVKNEFNRKLSNLRPEL
jgi:hypothetical protein